MVEWTPHLRLIEDEHRARQWLRARRKRKEHYQAKHNPGG